MDEFVETFTYLLIIKKPSAEYSHREGKKQHKKITKEKSVRKF